MKKEFKQKAILLRSEGKSLNEISQFLNISKSTASLWVRNVAIDADAKKALEDKNPAKNGSARRFAIDRKITVHRSRRLKHQTEGKEKAKEKNLLHQAGCMLYWAEGYKHKNILRFTNTDENMLMFFKRFLIESLQVPEKDIFLNIQYHEGVDDDISKHWEDKMKLSVFSVTKIKPRGNGWRKNRHPFGIVEIHVRNSTKYCQHIYGAIQEYASFDTDYGLD